MEAVGLRELGISNPIAVIPNGVELPDLLSPGNKPKRAFREALFLSQTSKKKTFEKLLIELLILIKHLLI